MIIEEDEPRLQKKFKVHDVVVHGISEESSHLKSAENGEKDVTNLNTKYDLWKDPGPDSGWSWVVAFSCCWITALMFMMARSASFLYVAIIETYSASRKEAAEPFSVLLAVHFFVGLGGSVLLQFTTMRQLVLGAGFAGSAGIVLCYTAKSVEWITFYIGVVLGSGIGLTTPFLTVIISEYFVKKRTTGNGISLAGRSICGFVFPPLILVLLNTYGLRGTFLILGGITSNALIGACLLRPRTFKQFPSKLTPPIPEKVDNDEVKHPFLPQSDEINGPENDVIPPLKIKSTFKQSVFFRKCSRFFMSCIRLTRNPVYALHVCTESLHTFIMTTTLLTLVDFSLDSGFTKYGAVLCLLLMNGSDLLARMLFGFIMDRGYLSRTTFIAIIFIISGGIVLIITFMNSMYAFIILWTIFGGAMGGNLVNIIAFYREYISQEELAIGIGMGSILKGVIFFLQSPFIGYFRDQVGSYVAMHHCFAVLLFIIGGLWLLLSVIRKVKGRDEDSVEMTTKA